MLPVLAILIAGPCGGCHIQSRQVEHSPMSATLGKAAASDRLRAQPALSVSQQGFQYRIETTPAGVSYEVTGGKEKFHADLLWFFGSGRTGQTFVYRHEGKLYESRVSYFAALKGLALTPGAANAQPANPIEAAGRLMNRAAVQECFGCHSSALAGKVFAPPEAVQPGVSCEKCHGGDPHRTSLRSASSEDISELCGQCHRTWAQVMTLRLRGVNTVRFQPYRLTQSKCYNAEDRRIRCTACHDPHRPGEISAAAVDQACRSCHNAQDCPTAKVECASCHMPKYDPPGVHARFSDHRIRVVKPGEPFPD